MKFKLFIVMFLFYSISYGGTSNMENTDSKKNLVLNKEMAIELAEVYIKNIYGENTATDQKPYRVENLDGIWIICGKPPISLGGSFKIEISEVDGKVIKITHSK